MGEEGEGEKKEKKINRLNFKCLIIGDTRRYSDTGQDGKYKEVFLSLSPSSPVLLNLYFFDVNKIIHTKDAAI